MYLYIVLSISCCTYPNSMIEIVPELLSYGHCSSPMLAFLCKNLDYKPQSINQSLF